MLTTGSPLRSEIEFFPICASVNNKIFLKFLKMGFFFGVFFLVCIFDPIHQDLEMVSCRSV